MVGLSVVCPFIRSEFDRSLARQACRVSSSEGMESEENSLAKGSHCLNSQRSYSYVLAGLTGPRCYDLLFGRGDRGFCTIAVSLRLLNNKYSRTQI